VKTWTMGGRDTCQGTSPAPTCIFLSESQIHELNKIKETVH